MRDKRAYDRELYARNRDQRLAAAKAYWAENKEAIKARRRAARQDPEQGPLLRQKDRARQRGNPKRVEWNRAAKVRAYGISLDDLSDMASAQGFMCGICLDPFDGPFAIDHDHLTGEVRGLLCNRCNVGLGMFRDSPALLAAATRYLDPAVPLEWDLAIAAAMDAYEGTAA